MKSSVLSTQWNVLYTGGILEMKGGGQLFTKFKESQGITRTWKHHSWHLPLSPSWPSIGQPDHGFPFADDLRAVRPY